MDHKGIYRVFAAGILLSVMAAAQAPPQQVGAPSQAIIESFKLKPFYKKCLLVGGCFPIVSSERVSDRALQEAAYIVTQMLDGRDDILKEMARNKVRLAIMAPSEMTTVIPEHSDLTPSKYWDKRARGLGATPSRPAVSCGEENLLCMTGDPYAGENILIHEFGHAIHEMGLRPMDKEFDVRLRQLFRSATDKGLWKGVYASTNPQEYWAEGVQSWFDCNQKANGSHNGVRTREELEKYDPELAKLIDSVFRNQRYRYTVPLTRLQMPHLRGYDVKNAPVFAWDPALVEWYKAYEKRLKPPR